jgi:hypothetical protein
MRSIETSRLTFGDDINQTGALHSMVGPTFQTGKVKMLIGPRNSLKHSAQESVSARSEHGIEGEQR